MKEEKLFSSGGSEAKPKKVGEEGKKKIES